VPLNGPAPSPRSSGPDKLSELRRLTRACSDGLEGAGCTTKGARPL
jgi:hypothetical protein